MKTLLSLLCGFAFCIQAQAVTNPPPATVTLEDFNLVGDLAGDQARFTLTATARVEGAKGGALDLLSGAVALTEAPAQKQWRIQAQPNRFIAVFDRGGRFPLFFLRHNQQGLFFSGCFLHLH